MPENSLKLNEQLYCYEDKLKIENVKFNFGNNEK